MSRLIGGVLTVVLAPVLAVIAVLVRALDGRPVIFAHERAGQGGHPFQLYKFRTMRPPLTADEPDEVRITRLGRVLRRTSMDELPSLWNVVRGDMNLVGPRPLPVAYTPLYSAAQSRRLQVKPGLTGPVQVAGRNALTWEEKFALDSWYAKHHDWRVDLRILWQTPLVVARGQGIAHRGHATMPAFTGNSPCPSGAGRRHSG
jgi:lipopolysaccharide/colanic/teichoic acid biosynthesis glycosyltransferase